MTKQTVESKTAKAILQTPQEVSIGGKTYQVAPPSVATLIMVSEAVSKFPAIRTNAEDVLLESLAYAKDCRILGDVLAILILGAKDCKKMPKWPLWRQHISRRKLARQILEELTPQELNDLLSRLLSGMQVSFFFGIFTSLSEVNLLRATRTETTASGRS